MIEIEKKFRLTKEVESALVEGAQFLRAKTFTDTYFDTPKLKLIHSDRWLRERDGVIELKVPMHAGGGLTKDSIAQYDEITDPQKIRTLIGLKTSDNLARDIAQAGYAPIATFTTKRRTYQKGEFVVDLDDVSFGYTIGEIELMVKSKKEMPQARAKILAFFKKHQLTPTPVRGKILELLARERPAPYKSLVATYKARSRVLE